MTIMNGKSSVHWTPSSHGHTVIMQNSIYAFFNKLSLALQMSICIAHSIRTGRHQVTVPRVSLITRVDL